MTEFLSRFSRREDGQIATIFAFCLIPLIGFMGVAIDYTRASAARDRLQHALDSAAIVAAHGLQNQDSEEEIRKNVIAYMDRNLSATWWSDYTLESVEPGKGTIGLRATGSIPTVLAKIIGVNELNFGASSQATWGTGKLEVALVLDNTGSMNEFGKMQELRVAAHALLDSVEQSEPGMVKVGIVPYNQNVRVSTGYKNAEWLKFGSTCTIWDIIFGNCRNEGGQVSKADWRGCLSDRGKNPYENNVAGRNYDTNDVQGAGDNLKYPAVECYSNGLPEILALTDDLRAAHARVTKLAPIGGTNITIGMSWALSLLSPQAPFTEAVDWGTDDVSKVIVLMTDGDNCNNRWVDLNSAQCGSAAYAAQREKINQRTRLACDRAKEKGITIYTVRLLNGNESLLKGCASDARNSYFNVENVEDLVPAFEAIGEKLSDLRISA